MPWPWLRGRRTSRCDGGAPATDIRNGPTALQQIRSRQLNEGPAERGHVRRLSDAAAGQGRRHRPRRSRPSSSVLSSLDCSSASLRRSYHFALRFGPREFFAASLLTFCSFVGLGPEAKYNTLFPWLWAAARRG